MGCVRAVVFGAIVVAGACATTPPPEDIKGPRVVADCEACDSHHYCDQGPPIRCEAFTVCGASCACALRDTARGSHTCQVVKGQVRISRVEAR